MNYLKSVVKVSILNFSGRLHINVNITIFDLEYVSHSHIFIDMSGLKEQLNKWIKQFLYECQINYIISSDDDPVEIVARFFFEIWYVDHVL